VQSNGWERQQSLQDYTSNVTKHVISSALIRHVSAAAEKCLPINALCRQGGGLSSYVVNTDQGSQFTSPRFTGVLREAGVRISMDGRGRWMDNVFIERLWRSLKYECIYLHAFETGSALRAGLRDWIGYYNARRPHSTLAGRTPDEAYWATGTERLAA